MLYANLRHLEVGLNNYYFVNNIMNHFYYYYIDTATVYGHMYQYDCRAGSSHPCVGGTTRRGVKGPPRSLVGPGRSPVLGFSGRSPRRKTISSVLEWLGRLSLALFCKKNHIALNRFSIVRIIKKYTIACFI